jgi:hypothetical protein
MLFISTSGHGYLRITHNQLRKSMQLGFVPTSFSYVTKSFVLLEEDCDADSYMQTIFPEPFQKKLEWGKVKSIHQNTISRKYLSTPETLSELEHILDIYSIPEKFIGKTMHLFIGNSRVIIGTHKSGYLYNDESGITYYMPFHNIKEII